ncbi:MAG: SGNH/GDSL hydrolase family protein, partial [Planctomycetota bacterium]
MSVLPFLTAACLAPPVIARLKGQPSSVTLLFLAGVVSLLGAAGLLAVFLDWQAGWLLVVVAPVLCIASLLPPQRSGAAHLLALLSKHRLVRGLLVMLLTLVILVGGVEWTVFLLADTHVIEVESPIRTVLGKDSEDWRRASIIADYTREPDPVLFWRSRPVPPYNAQRFQGPIGEVPKPPDVFRIICYGDSKTDGHAGDGGWPTSLGIVLEGEHEWQPDKRVEVLNAGVMGYSSYQGLMRFREEVQTYEPDLIFVSFGWNDAPGALGKPDKAFEVPPRGVVYLERNLLRFRSYRLLRTLRRKW